MLGTSVADPDPYNPSNFPRSGSVQTVGLDPESGSDPYPAKTMENSK